jgi:hypothetical protein
MPRFLLCLQQVLQELQLLNQKHERLLLHRVVHVVCVVRDALALEHVLQLVLMQRALREIR